MAKLFTDVLREMRFGETVDELSKEFNKLVLAVESTNRMGEITLNIKLKPSTAGAIEVIDVIKTKLPEQVKGSSIFFATPDGNLVRNDPRQKELDIKAVNKTPEKVKEVVNG